MITNNNTILKLTALETTKPMNIEIITQKAIASVKWEVTENGKDMPILACGEETANAETVCFEANIPNVKAWSVENPNLYVFTAVLIYADGETETISDRCGYRYFGADEESLYLNGYPFYMRGYIRGIECHDHKNNCNLEEHEFYRKNILAAKSYGFNTIRFHSTIPPKACFDVADELGILIHIEMRKESDEYDNLSEMIFGKDDFLSNEDLLNHIHTLYNHPSFMVYCVGNELHHPAKKPRVREIGEIIKQHDKTRLFLDTCAHGEYDRDYVDFDVQHMSYFYPYGKNDDMFENMDNLLGFGSVDDKDMQTTSEGSIIRRAVRYPRPIVAHEVCHYVSWRDYYALKEKFEKFGNPAPWWVDEEIKMFEAKGYKKDFKELLQITKDFQFRCWKTAFEAIRSSNVLAGFFMLQFTDTDRYENSNGLVDCFDDQHGISPEEFRKFNADTVLVAKLPNRVQDAGELLKVPVLLSQYKINPPATGTFTYTLKDETGAAIRKGELTRVDTERSGLYKVCGLDIEMPVVEKAQKLILECRMDFCDGTYTLNTWELWVFPTSAKLELDAKNDMSDTYLNYACNFNETSDLVITDKLTDETIDRVSEGQDTILIYRQNWTRHLKHQDMAAPQYALDATWDRYKGIIWDRGHQNGGKDNKDILNKYGFVTEGQINYQYATLIDDCDKINLDNFPVEVDNLIRGLDKANRDRFDVAKFKLPELMYDRTLRHFSYAFTVRIGKGRLLVTGFNFTGVDKKDPAVCAMLKTFVNYCHSEDFAPKASLTADEFKAYLAQTASEGPVREGMMTQYWQLDEEPVESYDYWVNSEQYLREIEEVHCTDKWKTARGLE